jgi:hypothetical protein
LGYKARIGKDTTADYLVAKYGFKKLSFADPLKAALGAGLGLTREQLYGRLKEVVDPFWGETPRVLLQKIGTDAIRTHFRDDVWVLAAKRKLLSEPNTNWVLPDCRFPNEGDMIHGLGGWVVQVHGGFEGQEVIKTTGHISENIMAAYNEWDYELHNDKGFSELYDKIDDMIKHFKGLECQRKQP